MMKKVSISVAARAYAQGRIVWASNGAGIQTGHKMSVRVARRKVMMFMWAECSDGLYLHE